MNLRPALFGALVAVLLGVCTLRAQQDDETGQWQPYRDYGHDWRLGTMVGLTPEDGVFLGAGPILYEFGFRTFPYVYRMELLGGAALKTGAFKVAYHALYPALGEHLVLEIFSHVSELEVRNFYGFGNDTRRDENLERSDFYRVASRQYQVKPVLQYRLNTAVRLHVAATLKHFEVRQKAERFLTPAALDTLGDDRTFVGTGVSLEIDLRDQPVAPTRGIHLAVGAWNHPDPFAGRTPFQRFSGDLRCYLTGRILTDVTLAVRAGGEKLEGSFPFSEGAFLGGAGNLRGFNQQRFGGDASVFGSVELRFMLGRMKMLVPTSVGLFVFGDGGRVWVGGSSPGGWHTDAGAGFSLAPVSREFTVSVSFASSVDGLFVNGGFGYSF